MNDLFLKALHCSNDQARPPVWLMRQAGRYMPAYRALREKYRLLELFKDPELIAEVTFLPLDQLGVDAAILFSDILILADALELGLDFVEGVGPVIERNLSKASDVESLAFIKAKEKLSFVGQGIEWIKQEIQVPLIGFAGAPYTLASYLIEGKSSRDLKKTKTWMYKDPNSFHCLLQKLTELTIDYLVLQVESGVDALQIFDSWANTLPPHAFKEFVLPYLRQILDKMKALNVPVIYFCRGTTSYLQQIVSVSPEGISMDWTCDLRQAREGIPKNIALQGNLDPCLLYAPRSVIKNEVRTLLDSMCEDRGFICNLGHGLAPDMQLDNVRFLVDCVKEYSRFSQTVQGPYQTGI